MRINDIENLAYLKKEKKMWDLLAKELQAEINNIKSHPAHPKNNALIEVINKRRKQVLSYNQCISDIVTQCELFINQIDDSYIKDIVVKKYCLSKSWEQISADLGGQSPDTIRMMIGRFLEKNLIN